MNSKYKGDTGQNCVIGQFARYGVGIAFPLSDNYRFDLVAIAGNKLFKVQVKSSSHHIGDSVVDFHITSNSFEYPH